MLVGLTVLVVAVVGLAVGAVHGARKVEAQRNAAASSQAAEDDAYYHCVDVQTKSLVGANQPVYLKFSVQNFGNYVTFVKAVGSWVHLVAHPGPGVVSLSLVNRPGPDACLGTQVVAQVPLRGGGSVERSGTGASLPGAGPPPAPPL